jgi:aminoglycoside phosphotransferase family enzyme/predicted kinase
MSQHEVIEFLSTAGVPDGAPVERIDTHTAIVFLSGHRALKLKRDVRFDYVDFSTLERREQMCRAEVRLNQRTAPSLYLGAVPVTREPDGTLALGGAGTPVDWVVAMNRFDQSALLDRLAAGGRLDRSLMVPLADAIARFHDGAERRFDHGGRAGMAWVIDGNDAGFAEQAAGFLDAAAWSPIIRESHAHLARVADQLDARRRAGFVRQCHGDLHLGNIVVLDGKPTLFDAIEFNDELACVDVVYDLAFLLMDLWHRGLRGHANAVWNRYLVGPVRKDRPYGGSGDFEAASLLPLFLSCRAAVRAKTSATAARVQTDLQKRDQMRDLAREYLSMAGDLLRQRQPWLIAIGGLSGSGKSTVALALAPDCGAVPGAVVLRSDEIRKQLLGVGPLDRLGAEAYTRETSSRVYAEVAERATRTIAAGHSAIVDAVFARPADRSAIEAVAARTGVPFSGFWLDAPAAVLAARAERRRGDPSDADAAVVRLQQAQNIGRIDWERIDASVPAAAVVEAATARLAPVLRH